MPPLNPLTAPLHETLSDLIHIYHTLSQRTTSFPPSTSPLLLDEITHRLRRCSIALYLMSQHFELARHRVERVRHRYVPLLVRVLEMLRYVDGLLWRAVVVGREVEAEAEEGGRRWDAEGGGWDAEERRRRWRWEVQWRMMAFEAERWF